MVRNGIPGQRLSSMEADDSRHRLHLGGGFLVGIRMGVVQGLRSQPVATARGASDSTTRPQATGRRHPGSLGTLLALDVEPSRELWFHRLHP